MTTISSQLPWYGPVAPGVTGLWDGGLMKLFRFRGPDIACMSDDDRVQLSERLNASFMTVDSNWYWHIEAQNVEVARYPECEWPTAASALLDAERAAHFRQAGAQYELRQYLALCQRHPGRGKAAVERLFTDGGKGEVFANQQIENFLRRADELERLLRSVIRIDALDDDETASVLKSTVSTQRQKVNSAAHPRYSDQLCDDSFTRGFGISRLGNNYITVLTLGGFSSPGHPQLLDALGRLPFEFRWSTRWLGIDRAAAKKMMSDREEKALGQQEYVKDALLKFLDHMGRKQKTDEPGRKNREEVKLADEAARAAERLSSRGYGYLSSTFVITEPVRGDYRIARRNLLEKRAALKSALQIQGGLVVREESVEPVKPRRMSLPGNRETGRRCFTVNTRNLADLMPTSSTWQGRHHDASLARRTKVKRPWMYTADPIPFRINTDVPGGAAHTLILGATGQAGKSTLANHLGFQFLGWPDSQIISLSVGRSELGSVLLNDGAAYVIGDPAYPAFQPLAHVDETAEALAALEWLQVCLEMQPGMLVTPARTAALGETLQLMASDAPERRTMTRLVGWLSTSAPELAQALKPYTRAGAYGAIFDGDNAAAIGRRRWTMFDVSGLLKMQPVAVVPAIAHLLHKVERWFDGRPTLLSLDEFPTYLHHQQLERFVTRVLDTQRASGVRALMIGQTPGQLVPYPRLMASVKSGCATTIFGPDSKAKTMADSYAAMDATDVEIDHIRKMQIGSYLLKNQYGSRVFELRAGPIARALTSTDDRAQLAELGKRCSDGNEMLAEVLRLHNLTDAARKLVTWKLSQQSPVAIAAE